MDKIPHNKIIWSDNEIKYLLENYLMFSNNELALKLNKTSKNVGRKLKELNLFKDSESRKKIKTRRNKETGTDLSFEYVSKMAKKYNSRGEFYQFDRIAYNKAVKEKWLNNITNHMVSKNHSIPQLLLKDLLEFLLNEKCSYNNRKIIKPLEIDCYFPKWKIGWEYDGRYYHNHSDDKKKQGLCLKVGVRLFNIHEFTDDYRDYNNNIKTQIINQLDDIKLITGINTTKEEILEYTPKIVFPNLLTLDEKDIVIGKKMSELKIYHDIFKKVKKYKLFNDETLGIINDLPKYKKFKNFEMYKEYLLECDYNNFTDLCKYEHPHRIMRNFNLSISLIHELFN